VPQRPDLDAPAGGVGPGVGEAGGQIELGAHVDLVRPGVAVVVAEARPQGGAAGAGGDRPLVGVEAAVRQHDAGADSAAGDHRARVHQRPTAASAGAAATRRSGPQVAPSSRLRRMTRSFVRQASLIDSSRPRRTPAGPVAGAHDGGDPEGGVAAVAGGEDRHAAASHRAGAARPARGVRPPAAASARRARRAPGRPAGRPSRPRRPRPRSPTTPRRRAREVRRGSEDPRDARRPRWRMGVGVRLRSAAASDAGADPADTVHDRTSSPRRSPKRRLVWPPARSRAPPSTRPSTTGSSPIASPGSRHGAGSSGRPSSRPCTRRGAAAVAREPQRQRQPVPGSGPRSPPTPPSRRCPTSGARPRRGGARTTSPPGLPGAAAAAPRSPWCSSTRRRATGWARNASSIVTSPSASVQARGSGPTSGAERRPARAARSRLQARPRVMGRGKRWWRGRRRRVGVVTAQQIRRPQQPRVAAELRGHDRQRALGLAQRQRVAQPREVAGREADAAADRHPRRVDEPAQVDQGRRQALDRRLDHRVGGRVAGVGGREHLARRQGPAERGAARPGDRAARGGVLEHRVAGGGRGAPPEAEVPGQPARSEEQATARHQAAADAGGDGHEGEVVDPAPGPEAGLAPGRGVGVVHQPDGPAAARLERRGQRELVPARHRGAVDGADGAAADVPGGGDAHRVGAIEPRRQQIRRGFHHRLGTLLGRRRRDTALQDPVAPRPGRRSSWCRPGRAPAAAAPAGPVMRRRPPPPPPRRPARSTRGG
jgi:hypothetical protein